MTPYRPSFRAGLVLACLIAGLPAFPAFAAVRQEAHQASAPPASAASPDTLPALLAEAEQNNPRIRAARARWQAQTQRPSQAAAPPDPVVTVEKLSLGYPFSFSGSETDEMPFTGVGVSQELLWPGKLKLRGEIAQREADVAGEDWRAVRREVLAQVRIGWYRLAASAQILALLQQQRQILDQIAVTAIDQYRTGRGPQQNVLRAQWEQTRLLHRIEEEKEQQDELQADLKQWLNRSPLSADLHPGSLTESALPAQPGLIAAARQQNPAVRARQIEIARNTLQVDLAHKEFYPDFTVGYMYENTGSAFPDRHMLSFSTTLPLFRKRRQQPALAEAIAGLDASRRDYAAEVRQTSTAVQKDWLAAHSDEHLLQLDQQALIPQAEATMQSALAGYAQGRSDLASLLAFFRDLIELRIEYWQTLAEHETLLSHLQQLAGTEPAPQAMEASHAPLP